MPTIRERAERHIARGSTLAHDVAAEHGQMFDNVKHMRWFLDAVIEAIRDKDAATRSWGLRNKFPHKYLISGGKHGSFMCSICGGFSEDAQRILNHIRKRHGDRK